jgi:hypothetical protein
MPDGRHPGATVGVPIISDQPEQAQAGSIAHRRRAARASDAPSPLAEPDPAEHEDDEDHDGAFGGQGDPVRVVGDQPRESTHNPPTV